MAMRETGDPEVPVVGDRVLRPRRPSLRLGWFSADIVLLVVVGANVILGLTRFNRYGMSVDEPGVARYAMDALASYQVPRSWESYTDLKYYGPIHFVFVELTSQWLVRRVQGLLLVDARHFVYHLTFQLAVVAIYSLSQRFMRKWLALTTAMLFATQPLLFGHSFINPKDTPFMAFFLVSVATGVLLSARLVLPPKGYAAQPGVTKALPLGWWGGIKEDWRCLSARKRLAFLSFTVLAVAVATDLLILDGIFLPFLQRFVARAYAGTSVGLINQWFSRVAQHAGTLPVEFYVTKATRLYSQVRFPGVAAVFLATIVVGRSLFPSLDRQRNLRALLLSPGLADMRGWALLVAGAASLGLATSTRVVGVFAGLLVSYLILSRGSWRAILVLIAYWGLAGLVSYSTWPYLWGSPIGRFVESAGAMASYPWDADVLYGGRFYESVPREWHYVVVPMLAQVTLPALGLAAVGTLVSAHNALRRRAEVAPLIVLALWLFAPPAAFVVLRSTIYDNSRQLQFVLPSMFVFAGIGLRWILEKIRGNAWRVIVVCGVILPGVASTVTLHPYEYIFHNALFGGVRGAFRSYELDYWCTSSRKATEFVNAVAQLNAEIAVVHWPEVVLPFVRDDLTVFQVVTQADMAGHEPDLAIVCTRSNYDLLYFREYEAVAEVKAAGALLAVVKDLRQRNGEFPADGPESSTSGIAIPIDHPLAAKRDCGVSITDVGTSEVSSSPFRDDAQCERTQAIEDQTECPVGRFSSPTTEVGGNGSN